MADTGRNTRTFVTYRENLDLDNSFPCVESDVSSTSHRPSTLDICSDARTYSPYIDSIRQGPDQDATLEQIGGIRNLKLNSLRTMEFSTTQRDLRPSSNHIAPSASRSEVSGADVSRSPSPPSRRRFRSRLRKDIHQVESEEPPETCTRMTEVQEALADAKSLLSELACVLSRSVLHRDSFSSISGLYQQASTLKDFQLPSSRIVGLVGDSGVGKSSLINSLLDKIQLARTVSEVKQLVSPSC
jgi:ABC-type multidrug transport system fused ATPase/permease subunit